MTTYWDDNPYWLVSGTPRAHLPHVEIAAFDATADKSATTHRHEQLLAAAYAERTARGRDVTFDFNHHAGKSIFYWGVAGSGSDVEEWQEIPVNWEPAERRQV